MNRIQPKDIKRFLIVNLGVVITAIGMHFFIIPFNLAAGGVSGIGMIIRSFFPELNLGLIMMVFNVILFILAFLLIGKEFGGYTIYASFTLSGAIGLLEEMVPMSGPIVDDMMIALIVGMSIIGAGLAIVFSQNASTGGTDIVAKIINKYTHMDLGKAVIAADGFVVLMAFFVFSPRVGMYAAFGVFLCGIVIDQLIAGFNLRVQAHIISRTPEKLVEYITKHLDRGATYIHITGGYSGEPHKMVAVVITKQQYLKLKNYLKENDPNAFIIINYVHDVLGEGFSSIK